MPIGLGKGGKGGKTPTKSKAGLFGTAAALATGAALATVLGHETATAITGYKNPDVQRENDKKKIEDSPCFHALEQLIKCYHYNPVDKSPCAEFSNAYLQCKEEHGLD